MVKTPASTTGESENNNDSIKITEVRSKNSADPNYPSLWRFETDGEILRLTGDWGGNPPEEYGRSPDPIERDYDLETSEISEFYLWTGTDHIDSGTSHTRKKKVEMRLLLKDREGDWIFAEPDSTPRDGDDDGYTESNIPCVEIKHDSQSRETTIIGYKVTQKIFEHYEDVIVLSWMRDFEPSAVNCSETTRVKYATAVRIDPIDE